jgi:hypothetical protein
MKLLEHLGGLRAAFSFSYVAPNPVGPLPPPYASPTPRRKPGRRGHPEEVVKLVRELVNAGLTRRQVATQAKVNKGSIDSILARGVALFGPLPFSARRRKPQGFGGGAKR